MNFSPLVWDNQKWIQYLKITPDHKNHPWNLADSGSTPAGMFRIKRPKAELDITAVEMSFDVKYISIGYIDGQIHLFELLATKIEQKFILEGHLDMITALSIQNDNAIMVSSSYDKTIGMWDLT